MASLWPHATHLKIVFSEQILLWTGRPLWRQQGAQVQQGVPQLSAHAVGANHYSE